MNEIVDFFDFTKNFKRVEAPTGCVSGSISALSENVDNARDACKRKVLGTEYTKAVVEKECENLAQFHLEDDTKKSTTGTLSCMDDLEHLSQSESDSDKDDKEDEVRQCITDDIVYDRYIFDMQREENLPISDYKEDILKFIKTNPVVILEGGTGCGKTTQVPQYILDEAYVRREKCNIICTQPRRIAAISVANRVSQERKWPVGSVVGYQVGLHGKTSECTRLLYCTTGVLLQKLICDKSMSNYTHIILDEVHERDSEMDFLLVVVRRLLTTNSKNVKIILMSATMNSAEFSNYFKINNKPAPILKCDNRRMYQVKEYYFCDLDRINCENYEIDYSEPGISKKTYALAQKLIVVIDNIEKEEARLCLRQQGSMVKQASILVFLPGINEIDHMCKIIEHLNNNQGNVSKLNPVRLHSLISPDEQIKAFAQMPKGFRKVILSTNIAESSITVPDVKYVIDFCLMKSLVTDSATGFSSLELHWASRSNCRQRAGRAGRVMNGRVYRLVSREFYKNYMDEYGIPELLRCPLENIVLKAKLLDMGPPPDILGLALSPPNLSDIHNTILTLKEAGALYTTANGSYSVQDGDITYMGRIMAALPLDIHLSRFIILGYIFSVLDEAIIIAAGLSVRSIFKFPTENPQSNADAYVQKLNWADGSGSDLFAILKAYRIWRNMREHSIRDEESENSWANRYFINLRSLMEMHLLVQKIEDRLKSFNIRKVNNCQRIHWIDRELTIILKIVIGGAFYPNYFTRSNENLIDHERDIYNTLCGNDPFSTVYFKNCNTRQMGHLYTHSIKELFSGMRIQPKDIDVLFQSNSEKVFVKFKTERGQENGDRRLMLKVPGRVKPDVFKAVRMRISGVQTNISVIEPHLAVQYAEKQGYGTIINGNWEPKKFTPKNIVSIVLPSLFEKRLRGQITYIDSCSKFYFLPLSESERLRKIHEALNDSEKLKINRFVNAKCIGEGMIVAAPLHEKYRRAKILKVNTNIRSHVLFQVLFIDSGIIDFVDFDQLRQFPEDLAYLVDLAPRVFECKLALIQPSTVKSPNGKWSDESKEIMLKCANAGIVEIEVYSLVEGVANVIIHMEGTTLNNLLVEQFMARKTDENYLSKMDHDYRSRKQLLTNRYLDENHKIENEEYIRSMIPSVDIEVEPPPKDMCKKTMRLRGPYSPLETTIYSSFRAGTWKSVHIEKESVNSVLLDTDPQDMHDRLMVAANISENQRNSIVTRSTTLMPNIHGLGALITMMFCPKMQIKRDTNRTKYVAVLAGLGFDPKSYKPLYGEHDVILNLDVELDIQDFELINQLRYYMDSILFTELDENHPNITQEQVCNCQAKIKEILIKLLNKNRKYIESHSDALDIWEYEDPNEIYESVNILGNRAIFPMLTALRLQDEKHGHLQALRLHCKELHTLKQLTTFHISTFYEVTLNDGYMDTTQLNIAKIVESMVGDYAKIIKCELCNHNLDNIVQLRIHLLSQMHRDREQQIGFKVSCK